VGTCDLATGVCSNPLKASGAPCDDGDTCTQADICQAGICVGSPLSSFSAGTTLWTTTVKGSGIYTKYDQDPGQWLTTKVELSSSGRAFFGVMASSPANSPFSAYSNTVYRVDGPGKIPLLASHDLVAQCFTPFVSTGIDIQVFGAKHYVINSQFTHGGVCDYTAYVDSDVGSFQSSYPPPTGSGVVADGNAAGDLLVVGTNGADLRRIDANNTTLYTRPLGVRSTVQAGAGGDAYLGGLLSAGLDLGCGPISGSGGFAARLDPMGQCVWSRASSYRTRFLLGGVVDYLTGAFQGTIDLGCGPLMSTSINSTYIAAVDAAGACVWSRTLDGPSPTLLPSGDLLVSGAFTGTLDLGCGQITSVPGGSYLVARIDAAGVCLWNRALAVPSAVVGMSASGDLTVGAVFAGTLDLGNGLLTSAGANDLAVARLDGSTGTSAWSARFGGAGATLSVASLQVDDVGGVLATGTVNGTADLGGGPLTGGFMLHLDGAGAFRWQRALAGNAAIDACGVTTTVTLTDTCDNCGSLKQATFTVERTAP
jgi:hypothetical protein